MTANSAVSQSQNNPHLLDATLFFELCQQLMQQKSVRAIGVAFVRFLHTLGMNNPQQLFASLALSEQEGRGHSCLLLAELANNPAALLGLKNEQWQSLQSSLIDLPQDAKAWRDLLMQSALVADGVKISNQFNGDFNDQSPLVCVDDKLYLRRYWRDEMRVTERVRHFSQQQRELDNNKVALWLDKLFVNKNHDINWQKIACAIAVRSQFSIITGGPGTGKTYTVARLLALLLALSNNPNALRIALAAPTGKAAARLKQSIDTALTSLSTAIGDQLPLTPLIQQIGAARTLHGLLGARPDTRQFKHHAGNPLEIDVLIVDEASMVHLEMMASLLSALPSNAMLVLLGDKDQLASVEAGAVLGDLCTNAVLGNYSPATADYILQTTQQKLPSQFVINAAINSAINEPSTLSQQTVMLRQSQRFDVHIAALANAVNQGHSSDAQALLLQGGNGIIHWQQQATQQQLVELAIFGKATSQANNDLNDQGYSAYLKQVANIKSLDLHDQSAHQSWVVSVLKAYDSLRVLCAVRQGNWGVTALNEAIEQALQTHKLINKRGEWYIGRPVMVSKNDYSLGVFNGDIGITLPDPKRLQVLRVYFLEGEQVKSVLASRLQAVETAFAMTVHKSQGSEFLHTVLALPPKATQVLTRELIYTGITRARTFFTLITPNDIVLVEAITQQTQRASGLEKGLHG